MKPNTDDINKDGNMGDYRFCLRNLIDTDGQFSNILSGT